MNVRWAIWMLLAATTGGIGCVSPARDLNLDQTANGKTFEVPVAGRVTVTLPSNATTGYRWELAALDTSILEKTTQAYEASNSGLVGAGGVERWEFVARASGEASLRLEYRRPWEPKTVDPAETFQIAVKVTPAGP